MVPVYFCASVMELCSRPVCCNQQEILAETYAEDSITSANAFAKMPSA